MQDKIELLDAFDECLKDMREGPEAVCRHDKGWHTYSSRKERQCVICKQIQKWDGDQWQITHKRRSQI